MDHRGRPLLGDAGGERLVHLVDRGNLSRLGLLELRIPALQLAGDVALLAGEVRQAHGVDVDGVQVGQHVDEVEAEPPPLGLVVHPLRHAAVMQDVAVDVPHDVERGAVHVGAEAQSRRHRNGGGAEGGDDLVLAAHVVRGGEHVVERWPAEDDSTAGGVGDLEGHVGVPARDEVEAQGWAEVGNVLGHPRCHLRDIDAAHLVHVPRR